MYDNEIIEVLLKIIEANGTLEKNGAKFRIRPILEEERSDYGGKKVALDLLDAAGKPLEKMFVADSKEAAICMLDVMTTTSSL